MYGLFRYGNDFTFYKELELYCEISASGTGLYFGTLYSMRNHIGTLFPNIFKEHKTFISFQTLSLLSPSWLLQTFLPAVEALLRNVIRLLILPQKMLLVGLQLFHL
jgi:hypothetical protein